MKATAIEATSSNESSNPTSQMSPPQSQTEEDTVATTTSTALVRTNSEANKAENCSSTADTVCYKRVLSAPAQLEIDYPKLAMYTTDPIKKLHHYCIENAKPEPYYQQHQAPDGRYIITVYVAKTCGRIEGDAKPTACEAKENAAEKLIRKLHIY